LFSLKFKSFLALLVVFVLSFALVPNISANESVYVNEDGQVLQYLDEVANEEIPVDEKNPEKEIQLFSSIVGGGVAKAWPIKGGAETTVELISPVHSIQRGSLTYTFEKQNEKGTWLFYGRATRSSSGSNSRIFSQGINWVLKPGTYRIKVGGTLTALTAPDSTLIVQQIFSNKVTVK